MVEAISENEFEEKVKGRCLVDFHTTWCGPCKMLGPVLEEVSKEHTEMSFYKVDLDENAGIAGKFGITTVPTMILFEEGKQIKKASGFMNKEKIAEFIK